MNDESKAASAPRFALTNGQIAQLYDFAGMPPAGAQLEEQSMIVIQYTEAGHAGPGLYAYDEDHPEGGAILLDGKLPERPLKGWPFPDFDEGTTPEERQRYVAALMRNMFPDNDDVQEQPRVLHTRIVSGPGKSILDGISKDAAAAILANVNTEISFEENSGGQPGRNGAVEELDCVPHTIIRMPLNDPAGLRPGLDEAYDAQFAGAEIVYLIYPPGTSAKDALKLSQHAEAAGVESDTPEGLVIAEMHF